MVVVSVCFELYIMSIYAIYLYGSVAVVTVLQMNDKMS